MQRIADPSPVSTNWRRSSRVLIVVLLAAAAALVSASPASAAAYTFVNIADSTELGFDPSSFGCASINRSGQVAFRAGRIAQDGFNTIPGIYRANRDGGVTTIAENARRYDFLGFNPSMNDRGVVSFAARIDGGRQDDYEAILTGAGANRVATVADTRGQFNFFGFDTSINNRLDVAFKAELDENRGFDEGLFSGRPGRITTHYLASTSQFDGTDSRPSINDSGIFVGRSGRFQTVLAPAQDTGVSEPVLNEAGISVFERSSVVNDLFVTEIVTGTTAGVLTVVVDTRGPFAEFGFRPPALNNTGTVAFLATLDDFTTTGIFVGPNPQTDRVIAIGDILDGDTITGLRFCEEGLNDSGQLTFLADFQDPTTLEQRTAVFRATPAS